MIHHLSIPARDTRHVAEVLVELFGGTLTSFGPYRDSFIAWAGDAHGTAIEVYPLGTEMLPDARREGWRAIELPRGTNHVIEFWIENAVMLELMTPDMAADYVRAMAQFRRPEVIHGRLWT